MTIKIFKQKYRRQKMFKKKKKLREKFLLEEFEKGRVLQVDNGIDNKQHFKPKEAEEDGLKEIS